MLIYFLILNKHFVEKNILIIKLALSISILIMRG